MYTQPMISNKELINGYIYAAAAFCPPSRHPSSHCDLTPSATACITLSGEVTVTGGRAAAVFMIVSNNVFE